MRSGEKCSFFLLDWRLSSLSLLSRHRGHWWLEWRRTDISINGAHSSSSKIYISPSGTLLVRMKVNPSAPDYLVDLGKMEVSINSNRNFLCFPSYAYSKQIYPPSLPLNGTEEKLNKFNARLIRRGNQLSFNSLSHGKIHVSLQE